MGKKRINLTKEQVAFHRQSMDVKRAEAYQLEDQAKVLRKDWSRDRRWLRRHCPHYQIECTTDLGYTFCVACGIWSYTKETFNPKATYVQDTEDKCRWNKVNLMVVVV